MFTVSKEIHFCYGHRLTDYDGKCRHLHGHNARAVITLQRETLDDQGMVVDFSEIGRVVGGWIKAEIDHNMLMYSKDPFLPALQEAGERVFVMDVPPTAENIARMIFDYVREQGYPVVDVTLWEADGACASYRG